VEKPPPPAAEDESVAGGKSRFGEVPKDSGEIVTIGKGNLNTFIYCVFLDEYCPRAVASEAPISNLKKFQCKEY
jgi:hypothetical protein